MKISTGDENIGNKREVNSKQREGRERGVIKGDVKRQKQNQQSNNH